MSDAATAQLIPLSGSITIREAEATHALLIGVLAAGSAVVLDCSGVNDADLSLVQLLIAARRSAAGLGNSFSVSAPPAGALLDVLVRGGFVDPACPDEAFWTSRSPQPQ